MEHRKPGFAEAHGPLTQRLRPHLRPACETGQARRAVAQHADVPAAERHTRFGFTVS